MSHFAKVENGIVKQVIVAEQDFINTQEGVWVQTSYNTYGNQHPDSRPLRGNYASADYHYDATHDVFYAPQPYPSWTLNQTTWLWDAPVARPQGNGYYKWDEQNQTWILS